MPGRSIRVSMLATALIAVAGGLAGCADDGSGALPTRSTIAVTSTAYVTIPARTTTSTVAPSSDDERGDESDAASNADVADDPTQERVYEIQSGDYLVGIASDFDVPVNYLPEYNGWDDGLRHALVPGEEMRIPPSDWDPTGPAAPGSASDNSAAEDTTSGAACADGAQQQSYTIQRGDTPGRVAAANDVTVAELAAANQGVAGYAGFVVGVEITIPC